MALQYANGKIVTSGLILALDASDRNSYVSGSTTWTDVSGNGWGGSLIGSASFTTGPNAFNTNCSTITDIGYLTPASQITFADASCLEIVRQYIITFQLLPILIYKAGLISL